jgi:DNA polymerase (family X)
MPPPSPPCSENSAGTAPCVRATRSAHNPFRAKAYTRAADNPLALSLPLDQAIVQDRSREISGVGNAIAEIITKLHATGAHPALEKMRKEIPAGVLEMLTVPGLRQIKF